MKKSMIDILACPMDKHHPLELFVVTASEEPPDNVLEGALYCTECLRFYPIMEEIPIMLPDDLRNREQEIEFLARYAESLPEKITAGANPWHL